MHTTKIHRVTKYFQKYQSDDIVIHMILDSHIKMSITKYFLKHHIYDNYMCFLFNTFHNKIL